MHSIMKLTTLLLFTVLSYSCLPAQSNKEISSLDFVQILNDNKAEAVYYYQRNWQALRKKAVKKGYIQSYSLLEVEPSEDQPYHLILITTYPNYEKWEEREENFAKLIEQQGELQLLNSKKPEEFRKLLFSKDGQHH